MPDVESIQHKGVRILSQDVRASEDLGLARARRARVHALARACTPRPEGGMGFTVGRRTRRSATVPGVGGSGSRPWH